MELAFTRLKELVAESGLVESDQLEVLDLLSRTDESERELVASLFEDDPSWVKKILWNKRAKEAALITEDTEAWQRIIDGQLEDLKKITS